MKDFNFKKYICCLIFAIICISAVIPLAYATTVSAKDLNTNLPSDDPVIDSQQPNNSVDDNQEATAPIFRNAYDALNYALDKLNNGKGHDMVISTTYYGEAYGIKADLYLYTESKRNGSTNYERLIMVSDIPVADDLYRINYRENDIVTYRLTIDINKNNITSVTEATPNWNNESTKLATLETYKKDVYFTGFDVIPVEINKKTSKVDYFTSNSKYYSLSFTVDTNTLSEAYLKTASVVGADSVSYSYLTFSFIIDKKTGKFISATKTEQGHISIRGFSLDANAVTNYNFKKVDEEVEIKRPVEDLTPSEEDWNSFKEENGITQEKIWE